MRPLIVSSLRHAPPFCTRRHTAALKGALPSVALRTTHLLRSTLSGNKTTDNKNQKELGFNQSLLDMEVDVLPLGGKCSEETTEEQLSGFLAYADRGADAKHPLDDDYDNGDMDFDLAAFLTEEAGDDSSYHSSRDSSLQRTISPSSASTMPPLAADFVGMEVDAIASRKRKSVFDEDMPLAKRPCADECDSAEVGAALPSVEQYQATHCNQSASDGWAPRVPSASCDIVQGVADRSNQCDGAWLRSMHRLTFFNVNLDLGHHAALAPAVATALASEDAEVPSTVAVALQARLVYADNLEPVALMQDKGASENIAIIPKGGNTKGGTELEGNLIPLASANCAANLQHLPAHHYVKVKTEGSSVQFHFKFGTNVTSRRHGRRNDGRAFCWQIHIALHSAAQEPLQISALSHSFSYISRPVGQKDKAQKTTLSVFDLATDGRPLDMITLFGEHLQHSSVRAEVGCGEATIAELPRLRASKSKAFVARLPSLLPGQYWIRMTSTDPAFEPSAPLALEMKAR